MIKTMYQRLAFDARFVSPDDVSEETRDFLYDVAENGRILWETLQIRVTETEELYLPDSFLWSVDVETEEKS